MHRRRSSGRRGRLFLGNGQNRTATRGGLAVRKKPWFALPVAAARGAVTGRSYYQRVSLLSKDAQAAAEMSQGRGGITADAAQPRVGQTLRTKRGKKTKVSGRRRCERRAGAR